MQPNYQQYPQPGYGQPAPQQQYYQPPTGQQPSYVQPTGGQPMATQYYQQPSVDNGPIVAADPTGGGGGGDGPLPRHLVGAAVAFICTAYDPNATFNGPNGPESKPSVTYDVYVLVGPGGAPHVEYGDSQERGKPVQPNCWRAPVPSWFGGIMCSNKGIVKELSPYAGTNRPLIARVELGSRNGFLLGKVEPQQREALIDLIGKHRSGQWQPPQSEPINGGPRPPAGAPPMQQQYAPPMQQQYAPQGYGQPAPQQQYAPPAGYAPVPQQQPAAAYPPPPGGQMQYPVPVQQAPAQPPAPGGYQGPPAPHGFDPAYWATLTPAQQAPFLS